MVRFNVPYRLQKNAFIAFGLPAGKRPGVPEQREYFRQGVITIAGSL
jgi:hypothetical protein